MNMKRTAMLPIIGPDLLYGKEGRDVFVKGFMASCRSKGYKPDGSGNRIITPDYVGHIGLFGDVMTKASQLMLDGYKLKLSFGGLYADPVMMDRCMGSMILVLPIVAKGAMIDDRVRDKYQDRFEALNFTYVTGLDYNVYRTEGRVYLNPVVHDRVSHRVFMLNLLIAVTRGYRVHVVPV